MKFARKPVLINFIALILKLILKPIAFLMTNGLSPPKPQF